MSEMRPRLGRAAPIPPEAAAYERYGVPRGAPFTPPLLALAPPPPAGRVLDVACGTGIVARAVAARVGPEGLVLGVDLAPAMVAAARIRADGAGLDNCRFAVMDAHALALHDAACDAAYCQFGLMLMADPPRAIAEIARVLRPGAAVAAVVWSEPAAVAAFATYLSTIHAHVPDAHRPEHHPVFSLAAPGALAALCAGAGLAVEHEGRVAVTDYHADGTAYWLWASEVIGFPVGADRTMRRIVHYPPALQAAVQADLLDRVRAYRQADGRLGLPSEGVLVRARRPGAPGRGPAPDPVTPPA